MKRRTFTTVLVLVLGLVVGTTALPACAPAPAAPRDPKPRPTAPAIRAGTSGNYPPLSVWTAGGPTGFAPELVAAFARAERREIVWSRFRWADLESDLRAGRFDVAADGITVRPERSLAGRFTVPIARGGAVLLVHRPRSGPPEGVAELDRSSFHVVVNRGAHLERVTRGLFHAAEVEALEDNGAVREAFAAGRADAAMTNTFEAPSWAEGVPDAVPLGPLTNDVTAVWLRAEDEDLAAKLDTFLLDEEASGRLGALRAATLGRGGGGPTALPVPALVAATAERLALMPLVAAAKRQAGKPIFDPAQEERILAAAVEAVTLATKVPPPRAAVERFFRAQMEAAKEIQAHVADTPATASLDALRAAIGRITTRMARLVGRVPRGTTLRDAWAAVTSGLDGSGLDDAHAADLAAAIAALAPAP